MTVGAVEAIADIGSGIFLRIDDNLIAKPDLFTELTTWNGFRGGRSEAVTREDLAALIGVKFEKDLQAPPARTEILVDIATSWAQRYIVQVASLEIIRASVNHTFQPRRIVNRAELADAAVRLIAILQERGAKFVPLVETRRIQIADVTPDNPYDASITKAVGFEIMTLTPDRKFEPERTVSGDEAIRTLDLIQKLAR